MEIENEEKVFSSLKQRVGTLVRKEGTKNLLKSFKSVVFWLKFLINVSSIEIRILSKLVQNCCGKSRNSCNKSAGPALYNLTTELTEFSEQKVEIFLGII